MTESRLPMLLVPDAALFDPPADVRLIDVPVVVAEADAVAAMCRDRRGAGIAWPQCGLPRRAFLFCPSGTQSSARLFVNPRWEPAPENDDERPLVSGPEGCFSTPGWEPPVYPDGPRVPVLRHHRIRTWFIEIERWRSAARARLRAMDAITFAGWDARVFQHEADHLEGRVLGRTRAQWFEGIRAAGAPPAPVAAPRANAVVSVETAAPASGSDVGPPA